MKKLNIYEINDGIDGVVLAKSLKQATEKLAPYYSEPAKEIFRSIKEYEKNEIFDGIWVLTSKYKVAKKGINKRARVKGWCE